MSVPMRLQTGVAFKDGQWRVMVRVNDGETHFSGVTFPDEAAAEEAAHKLYADVTRRWAEQGLVLS